MMTVADSETREVSNGDDAALPSGIDFGLVWTALTSDTQCCVVLADTQGKVRYGNLDEGCSGCGSGDCPFRSIENVADKLPAEQAQQLFSCMRRACENNAPIVLVWFLKGIRSRTVIRPVSTDEGQFVLLTTRSAKGANLSEQCEGPGDGEIVHSLVGDAGPLASLTVRETQVLELIGRGYSTAKIAEHLNRSTKTIEWHRASIGNKLNASNRVELARIAIAAGLTAL